MDGYVPQEKSPFKMLGLSFPSKLDWDSYIGFIAKTVSKKIRVLIRSVKILSPEVIFYQYKYTIRPCMEYCCHAWAGAPSYYLDMLDKYRSRYAGLLVLDLLPLLNIWLIVVGNLSLL